MIDDSRYLIEVNRYERISFPSIEYRLNIDQKLIDFDYVSIDIDQNRLKNPHRFHRLTTPGYYNVFLKVDRK